MFELWAWSRDRKNGNCPKFQEGVQFATPGGGTRASGGGTPHGVVSKMRGGLRQTIYFQNFPQKQEGVPST